MHAGHRCLCECRQAAELAKKKKQTEQDRIKEENRQMKERLANTVGRDEKTLSVETLEERKRIAAETAREKELMEEIIRCPR